MGWWRQGQSRQTRSSFLISRHTPLMSGCRGQRRARVLAQEMSELLLHWTMRNIMKAAVAIHIERVSPT
eukprot:COSAG06_NODE_47_length_29196_cov_53.194178_8_plen_69_part_00